MKFHTYTSVGEPSKVVEGPTFMTLCGVGLRGVELDGADIGHLLEAYDEDPNRVREWILALLGRF